MKGGPGVTIGIRGCLVTGHSQLVDSLTLPDPDDRHVLAAAIYARAGLIVSFNLFDFAPQSLARHGVGARHPNEFFPTSWTCQWTSSARRRDSRGWL